MRALRVLSLVLLLAGCAHQAKKVDCEAHLTAINPPTPVVKPDPAAKKLPP